MEDLILVKYQCVGGPGSYQESAGTLTSTHTHERDSPKMPTVLVEGNGKAVGREERRREGPWSVLLLLDYPADRTGTDDIRNRISSETERFSTMSKHLDFCSPELFTSSRLVITIPCKTAPKLFWLESYIWTAISIAYSYCNACLAYMGHLFMRKEQLSRRSPRDFPIGVYV